MSSFAGYCDYCGKPVMHKTLFGTLHVCLSPEERQSVDMMRQQQALMADPPLKRLFQIAPQLAEVAKEKAEN